MKISPSSKVSKLIIIGELILVSYLLYTLTVSVYKSYQIDLVIAEFQEENNKIAEANRELKEDFDYYSSDNYIDKIAKQNLNLINPGEQVVIIPKTNTTIAEERDINPDINDEIAEMSNLERWYVFFFDR